MTDRYILNDHGQPEQCHDIMLWAKWIESANRTVARTEVDGKMVSTVFLGLSHNFGIPGDPILWETMIFNHDGSTEEYQERYSSKEDAMLGHDRAVESLKHDI